MKLFLILVAAGYIAITVTAVDLAATPADAVWGSWRDVAGQDLGSGR